MDRAPAWGLQAGSGTHVNWLFVWHDEVVPLSIQHLLVLMIFPMQIQMQMGNS